MNLLIFTVFDSAAQAYLEPFFAGTVEVALRMFRQVVNKEGHQFNKFPEDYTLFVVGEFSQEDAELVAYETARSLGVAVTFMDTPRLYEPEVKHGS